MLVFFFANILPWILMFMMIIGFIGFLKYYKELDMVLNSIEEAIIYNKKINWKEVLPYTWPFLTCIINCINLWIILNIEKFL